MAMSDNADMSDANGTRARYNMAGGSASSDFGVQKIDSHRGPSMGPTTPKMLSDSERGAGMPVKHTSGKMPSQAMPDHGPHGPLDTSKRMPMGGMAKRSGDMAI